MHGVIHGGSARTSRQRDPILPDQRIRRPRYSAAQLRRGTDGQGRFIGPRDLDAAWQHFWNAPHRRACAPIVHGDFDCRAGNSGAPGQPRASKSGLTPDDLRAIWAERERVSQSELARRYGVTQAAISYHLRPSVAMHAALASVPAAGTV